MLNISFDTNQPSQIQPLEGYRVDPLFTVGETLGDYTPIGILDGTGAFSLNDTTVRVLVNHEVGNSAGYKYTLASGAELTGARISYFDIDKRTLKIVDSGLAFDTIYNRAGEEVTPTTPLYRPFGVRPADPYNQLEDQTSLWNFGNIAQGHWVALVPLNDQNDLRAQHLNPHPLVSQIAAVSPEAPHVPPLPGAAIGLAGFPKEAVAVAGGEGVICSPAMDGVSLSDGQ